MSNKFEAVLLHVLSLMKTDMEDYCDLETIDGGRAIVAKDGSLASIVAWHGTKSVLGRDQFDQFVGRIEDTLGVYFNTRGHQLQVVFRKDLDGRRPLEQNAEQQHIVADRLNLALHDLIEESVEKYAAYVYDEQCYLVFWSRPALLDAVEAQMSRESVNEFRKTNNWPATANAQNLLRPISYLRDRHLTFVSTVFDNLSNPEFGCSVEWLDVEMALRAIRSSVLPDVTSATWCPAIPGQKIPFRWKNNSNDGDLSEVLYPPLPSQIFSQSGEIGGDSRLDNQLKLPDPTTVRVGSRVYAPLLLSSPPRDPQYFNALFNSLSRAETVENGAIRSLPFSLSFMLEADGMSVMMFKSFFASLLSITSEQNRNMNLAAKALGEYKRDSGCIVKIRIAAMTWANLDQEGIKELRLRKTKLWRTLEGWGNPIVTDGTGNPMMAFQSNALGLTPKHIGNPCPAPLSEAISLLPLTRPASAFPTGSIINRSLDGKIMRYQRFSSEQTTWITLMSGKPGSGKSVLLNHNNLQVCLAPGNVRLPFIGTIDVGISSKGFTDSIRDALPENLRHQVLYKRLQNSAELKDDFINPLDTALGKREPIPRDRFFIRNFITMLVTPPERQGKALEGMSNLVGVILDLAYRKRNDRFEKALPETYKHGTNLVVDSAVQKLGYKTLPATTYWEIVDALFDAGYVYEAEVAQRYAMPTLNTLVNVASSPEVKEEYGSIEVERGRSLLGSFISGIREAVGEFPIFSQVTSFDVGSARIIALDLQDVTFKGGDEAIKQTALMYMIARQAFMKKVAFSTEDLKYFDNRYSAHYERLINEIAEENKVFCMDEYHRTEGNVALNLQVETDGRESRKWKLEIVLASQKMSDFGELTKLATSIFILDSGTEETRKWLRENIGLTPVEESALMTYVHGPSAHGATYLARFYTKSAVYTQLFTMTVGPMLLWSLSTTGDDRRLRDELYKVMSGPQARRLLAKRFPSGSCQKLVERLKAEQRRDNDFIDDAVQIAVIEKIARELIREFNSDPTLELEVA